jgi:hypothetical protein
VGGTQRVGIPSQSREKRKQHNERWEGFLFSRIPPFKRNSVTIFLMYSLSPHPQIIAFSKCPNSRISIRYSVKKINDFPVPSRDVINQALVSDIPAGDGKMANLFLQCICNVDSLPVPKETPTSKKLNIEEVYILLNVSLLR